MVIALKDAGLQVCSPLMIPVFFRNHPVGDFEGDVLVGESVLLELKVVRTFDSAHQA